MANVCVLRPLTKSGQPSKLYEDLYKFTGEDRPLTNFLYGISLLDETKNKFTKKEISSNGEIYFDDFVRKLNLKTFLKTEADIRAEKLALGAIDNAGDVIQYDEPNSILPRVLQYNENTNEFRATVSYDNGKFVIKVDRVNARNFRNNDVLNVRKAQFDGINQYLSSLGFKTAYQDDTISSIANFLNVSGVDNVLRDFKRGIPNPKDKLQVGLYNLTIPRAQFLIDLMNGNTAFHGTDAFLQRLLKQYGDETAEILSIVSRGDTDARLTSQYEMIANSFLLNAFKAFQNIDFKDMDDAKEIAVGNVALSNDEWFGIGTDVLNSTLRELYDTYHINQDIFLDAKNSLSTLSEIAEHMYNVLLTRHNVDKASGSVDSKTLEESHKGISMIGRILNRKDYAVGIVAMMQELLDNFEEATRLFQNMASAATQYRTSSEENLQNIATLSRYIYQNIKMLSAYQPIIDALVNLDGKTLDQQDLPNDFVKTTRQTAKALNDMMSSIRDNIRSAQFETIYSFISMESWGEEDVRRTSSGRELSLKSILETLAVDPSFLDRMIYSINECSDTGLALVHNVIKTRYRERDARLRTIDYIIREINNEFGEDSSFMYERDAEGKLTGNLKSYVDYNAYYAAKNAYIQHLKDQGIRGKELRNKISKWIKKNYIEQHLPFDGQNTVYNNAFNEYYRAIYGHDYTMVDDNGNVVPAAYVTSIPDFHKYHSAAYDSMSDAEKNYYSKMMALKAVLSAHVPENLEFFSAVQISGDILNTFSEFRNNPAELVKAIATKFADSYKMREDDDDYGALFGEVLAANGMYQAIMDINGHEFMKMPLFFTRKLRGMSRLSTNMNSSMLAYAQTAMQYYEMNKIADALLLVDDYFRTQRNTSQRQGGNVLVDITEMAGKTFTRMITRRSENTNTGAILTDLYERELYGRKKQDEGYITLFGVKVSVGKAADLLTAYTSTTGLTVNVLGAQANLLVGKLQTFIEGFSGEFFDLADAGIAEAVYLRHLPEYLNEAVSNNQKSFMATIGDRFHIKEGFYAELREKGFKTSLIGRILNNTNLFMLYGMGEHMLHFQGGFSVLHAIKVLDSQTGNEVTLLKALENSHEEQVAVNPNAENLEFYLNTNRYKWIEENGSRDITDDDLLGVERKITYVNKSMHGAFDEFEKGLVHRYVLGRLIMNFRQWMPAHYQRRFRSLHYDADLHDDREGYYISAWHFLTGCVEDLRRGRFQIAAHWNEMSDMERYNMKRCIAEVVALMTLSVSNLSLGDYKDKRGNWAYRNLMYQTKRMLMETRASAPLPDVIPLFFGEQAKPMAFIENIMSLLNSPMAALNTIDSITSVLDFSKLLITIEGGKYDGQNLYWHDFEKNFPYYGSIKKQADLSSEDYMFQVFK